jgi:FkbM family methyltransferase
VNRSEADTAYDQIVPVTLRLCREAFGLQMLQFLPREGSPLRVNLQNQDWFVALVADGLMCPIVLKRHRWQVEELKFAQRVCTNTEPLTLVDVGANMGLFSRQLLAALPNIVEVFAYEPEAQNFGCLGFNLLPFQDKVHAVCAALGNVTGTQDFYLDPTNSGNFSLNRAAMPSQHGATRVATRDVSAECAAWLAGDRSIFYKSDTQGFDELIATTIRPEVWLRVSAGIMELWRIEKPQFDLQRLGEVLDQFPNKIFLANADLNVTETSVSTAEVLQFISSTDHKHRDLGFWR